jgi:hypothetical protein
MPDAACRVKWLVGRCAPSRVIWDAERLLLMSTSDGFRQWNKISGTKACYWEGPGDLWHGDDSAVTLFIMLKLTTPF